MTGADEPFLRELVWLAASWDEPVPSVVPGALAPELDQYFAGFGRRGDRGLVALIANEPVGGCWIREMQSGYGFVAVGTGELSLAVVPAFRGRAVGSTLLEAVLAAERGAVSLSVDPANPSVRLYERAGFTRIGERQGSLLMLRQGPDREIAAPSERDF